MTTQNIREKFAAFFKSKGHIELPASSLIPTDPSVLFTTAGMQQFKEWFVNPELAKHKRVVTIQPCLRTSDIEEVGDETHLTYFEMLGHFSFGDYFKKDAIEWGWNFITKELSVSLDRVNATYFGGDDDLPADAESLEILKNYLPADRIEGRGREDNFWGPIGEEGPCGPNIEFYVDGVEIWNSVFNEYYFRDGKYTKLATPGVDMGGGLERIATVINDFESVFETDEVAVILVKVPTFAKASADKPEGDIRSRRIIADHSRAINALIKDGVTPSNKAQGAVLRRLIRRAFTHGRLIGADDGLVTQLVSSPDAGGSGSRPHGRDTVAKVVEDEITKFSQTLKQAMNLYSNVLKNIRIAGGGTIAADDAFLLQESYGLPFELTQELARKDGFSVDKDGFEKLVDEHRQKSRSGIEGKFKGGLVEITPETTRLHTAHHLLLAALRKVLGTHVVQRGSNITAERLRIDFSHQETVNREQLTKVENLVNGWIKDDFAVTHQEMPLEQAIKKGVLGEFGAAYPEKVSVYSIGPHSVPRSGTSRSDRVISIEICGGPHVAKTSEISKSGKFGIIQEESSGAGIRRIRAVIN